MGEFFDFQDEDGEVCRVEFELLDSGESLRRYGIRARLFREGSLAETAEATERFMTREEAEQTAKMLCRFQVTPCTLCDIV